MKVNINQIVRVRLTPEGKSFLIFRHAMLNEKAGLTGGFPEIIESKDGWSYWQLWSLMRHFGSEMSPSGPMMFAAEIELVPSSESVPS